MTPIRKNSRVINIQPSSTSMLQHAVRNKSNVSEIQNRTQKPPLDNRSYNIKSNYNNLQSRGPYKNSQDANKYKVLNDGGKSDLASASHDGVYSINSKIPRR
jgi:hypothetical protein